MLRQAGELRVYAIDGAKSQRRWFCTACGTILFRKVALLPHLTGIAGGCFAETPLGAPTATVANEGRCAWHGLPPQWQTSMWDQLKAAG